MVLVVLVVLVGLVLVLVLVVMVVVLVLVLVGLLVLMVVVLFWILCCYTDNIVLQTLVRNDGERRRSEPFFLFCDDRLVLAAGRSWAVRVESGGILSFLYLSIWSCGEQKPKRECFGFKMVCN